jgi:hypothetical protein
LVCDNLTPVPCLRRSGYAQAGLSSWKHGQELINIDSWRGECKREGASPPLKVSPPLKQTYFLSRAIRLFERGIKGESLNGVSIDDGKTKTE